MKLIAAVDRNWAIGKDGDQLVYLKDDLKRFRALTEGHCVVMGRKTLEALPGGAPLKNRRNVVLSRDEALSVEGAEVCRSVEEVLEIAPADAFVIGGAQVYRALLPHCDTAYITKIDGEFPADCWFPKLDEDPRWTAAEESEVREQDGLMYRYVTYRRTV